MYRVDITADLNDEDETGYVWTFLDEARDPEQIKPGALIVAGDEDTAAVCEVVDLAPAGDGIIVHLRLLPDGSPHTTPVFVGAHGDRIVFFTGPGSLKARNLRRDPRMAPADNPFQPVVVRGRVEEWLDGDAAWEIIDQLALKYTGAPYSREQERVVAVIEPRRQTVGVR